MINDMINRMIENMKKRVAEYSHYFSHSKGDISLQESAAILGSPKHKVSLYDDFEPSHLARPNLNEDMHLPSLE